MNTFAAVSPTLFVLGLFLLSTVVGAVVTGSTSIGSTATPASTSGTSSASANSVGTDQLTQAQQSFQAGQGPGIGEASVNHHHPSARYYASMTYDSKNRYVVLFGGVGSSGVLGDTWKFVGGNWTQLHPTTSPPARFGAGMTYDTKDRYVVLFGGTTGTQSLNDTWTFVNGAWTNITSTSSPAARFGLHMAYDAKNRYVVLFGGASGTPYGLPTGIFNDTWKFVGGVWTFIDNTSYPPGPGGLADVAMTYDAADGYVVLNGGSTGYGGSSTWTYVKGTWTHQFQNSSNPEPWYGNRMTYDAKDGYVVMYGGLGCPQGTWQFVGGVWTQLTPTKSPTACYDMSMTYDAKDGYVVLFGGISHRGVYQDQTWTFVAGNWTKL